MKRLLTAVLVAGLMAASQASATLSPLDRAGPTQQSSNQFMGMDMAGDSGGLVLLLGLLLIVAVAIEGNNHNDQPSSP